MDLHLIPRLVEANCIQIGQFKLKSGDISKYYFDMKNLVAHPLLLKEIGDALYKKMGEFDIICGVPYGGLPIASYISTTYNKPLIYMRDSVKKYGTQKRIEGSFKSSDRCVIVDDVVTSGGSLQEVIEYLEDKLIIEKCIVVIDRQQSKCCTYEVDSIITKTNVVNYRLQEIKNKKNSDLCFAADVSDIDKLWRIIDIIGPYIVVCKIHYDIVPYDQQLLFKKRIIELSIEHNFLIMEDRKFNDISYIVKKQYQLYENWVDLVTVHALVTSSVIKCLSGAMIVANMSNNSYDFIENAVELATENEKNVIGFITQCRMGEKFICMTPGISLENKNVDDQKYRSGNIDTDIRIIGRAIYDSKKLDEDIKRLLYYE